MQTQTLKLTQIKELFFAVVFTALSVYAPIAAHYFGGVSVGRAYLPMHFFVLAAGLFLGWRAGLFAGLASPVISHLISGMPMLSLLPFIAVELSFYGLIAGVLRHKLNLNIFISLTGALIAGRIFLMLSLFLFSDISVLTYMKSALVAGWRGIVLQIVFVPLAVGLLCRYFDLIVRGQTPD